MINMKKLLALLITGGVAVSAYAGEFADISIKEVNKLAESKSAVILDVNGDDSFKAGHVPGAINFTAVQDNLAANLPKKKDALIIAYCGNPKCGAYLRAAKAAEKLGYTNIMHMSAGISGWKAAGMKIEPGT
jgi:rhodanese-related sulfurtransferase